MELNNIVCKDFYKQVDYLGYRGHRLLAVDGSFLNLSSHESIKQEFDSRAMGRGKLKDVNRSMCLLSMLYDPANYMTVDVQTGSTDGSELQLLLKHLPKVNKSDILLLDHGYPAKYLFSLLQSRGIHFVVRMKSNRWMLVKEFADSTRKDIEVMLKVPDGDFEKYKMLFPAMKKAVKCRLVKVKDQYGLRQSNDDELMRSPGILD